MAKYVEPSVSLTAFSCAYCGTLTSQHWSKLHSKPMSGERKTPLIPDEGMADRIRKSGTSNDQSKVDKLVRFVNQLSTGELFYERDESGDYVYSTLENLNASQCYDCKMISVWLHDRLLYPAIHAGEEPNDDLDDEIKRDFNEARSILDSSPRGSAALLRLALQKLCKQLGESGENIDQDIASLVGKGLNPVIQQSLDVIRVVGNEAVHPGTLDLRDDRDTAVQLFLLVNSIADQMVSHPKKVEALYGRLPAAKRAGIDARNAKAIEKASRIAPNE